MKLQMLQKSYCEQLYTKNLVNIWSGQITKMDSTVVYINIYKKSIAIKEIELLGFFCLGLFVCLFCHKVKYQAQMIL